MKLVDANVLLAASNPDAAQHADAYAWLTRALSGAAPVGFAWNALLAFVRISTLASVFPEPFTVGEAMDHVDRWLQSPSAHGAGARSPSCGTPARAPGGRSRGRKPDHDAHLAAIALEHRAAIVTFDRDFGRFTGVRWVWPSSRH